MSPRSKERNEEIRAETRARIVEHALALFGTRGYASTPVGEIARAAGISQGLLYHYFRSKEDLLRAVCEQSMGDVYESFARAEAAADPRRRVEALIRASSPIIRRNIHFWRLSYAMRWQPEVLAGLGPLVQEWTSNILRTLEGYFREAGAGDPAVEAAALFAVIDGVHQHYVLDPDRYPLDAVTEAVIARYAPPVGADASAAKRRRKGNDRRHATR
jgi:AcrR family transcriptional regulator